ncbi:chromosome segregation protein SMC [Acinetobacter sp. A3.8]|uniref:Chromosome partition protein Smc n=1 Tax=Acinetobacter sedimenti TaxID=2919922 RepID=A0A9X1WXT0_9GAMM|nr:chromosome segregation protein SMC [Acinetobacter sedimenti]MCJ8145932.1 chromosome segregation protein SMC [Acinetobacter sedimenti]
MRLSSLKLAGFKSFSESTTLHFKDNRSAIVGPNGCGKSNVIDAIRWVMGESSAKQLRGGNMQDVIFAGSSSRKPNSVASVELRFENTLGKLGGAYNAYTELSVKRQVNREGKSEYFLNGTRCRRKDITDIFLGTGLGPRSYAVIEQGMINRLVDAKPEEMRVFIEEAAGISRYQARRKETLQHLEHTQDNLSRLHDIASELKSQIRTLNRQAEQAEKYQKLKTDAHQLKVQLWSNQFHQHGEQVAKLAQQLATLNQNYQTQHKALEQTEIETHLLQQKLQQQLPQSEQLQKAWQSAKEKLQQSRWQLEQDQQHIERLQHNIAKAESQQQSALLQYDQQQSERENLQTQLAKAQDALAEYQQLSEDSSFDLSALQVRMTQHGEEFNQLKQSLNQLQQQRNHLHYQYEQVQKNRQRAEQQAQHLQSQLDLAQDEEIQLELDDVQIELASVQIKIDDEQRKHSEQQNQLEQLQQQKNQLEQQQQHVKLLHKNLEADIRQTEKLLNGLNQNTAHSAEHPLLSQLQLTEQGKQHSELIEKVLAKWLQANVVDDLDWSYQGQRQLILSKDLDFSKIDGLESINTWISSTIHPLWQGIYIAKTLTDAQENLNRLAPHTSIITKDGYWLAQDWWINLNLDTPDQAGLLHYHQHLQSLQSQFQDNQKQIEPIQQQLDQVILELKNVQTTQLERQQQLKTWQNTQQQLFTTQTKLQAKIEHQAQNTAQYQEQLHVLQLQLQDDEAELEQIQYDKVALELKINEMQPQVDAGQELATTHQQKLHDLQAQSTADQKQLQDTTQSIQQLQSKLALMDKDQDFHQERMAQLDEQQLGARQQITRLQTGLEKYQANVATAQADADQSEKAWQTWQQGIATLQTEQQQLSDLRQQQQQDDQALRDQLENTRLQWQQHKTEQHHAKSQLEELGAQAIDVSKLDSSQLYETVQTSQVKAQLEQLEQQLQKMGAVNLVAFEELQEKQARFDELDHQIQDLEQTVAQLQDAMQSIDQETKQLFMKTFDQINRELQDLFPKVFTGGEASLSLEDDWQSGVRLMARPPGKRNSTLALLSGGEKALTALALVFAIFRLNPAPFCVLDEVDAPLDDANVNRFCNLVKELSQQVQFIYITHNKLAMTMATDLLGVTMPEAGSSKLVAVSLAQAEAYGMTE